MGFEIKSIWAFVAIHPGDEDEGVTACKIGDQWMPLIAADEKRLKDLRPMAQLIARETKIDIKLVRFDVRTELETIRGTP